MIQAKIQLSKDQNDFLNNFKTFGFKNRSSMVRLAIDHLKKELETLQLKNSARIYSEIYQEGSELKELTESSLTGWPE